MLTAERSFFNYWFLIGEVLVLAALAALPLDAAPLDPVDAPSTAFADT